MRRPPINKPTDALFPHPTVVRSSATGLQGPYPERPIVYATPARDGDCFAIGQLEIRAMETPGHTDDHLAYALFDTAYPDKAVGVFTGVAMFVGAVGRTDFYPDRRTDVAGLLFDYVRQMLALGDQDIASTGPGRGWLSGSGQSDREIYTN